MARLIWLLAALLLVPTPGFAQPPWGFGGKMELLPWGTSAGNTTTAEFYELVANGAQYTYFKAPDSIATTWGCVWPSAPGTAGQVMATDGANPCTLSWASGTGTVTNTGTLTANAFILGNGTVDVKALALTGLVLGNGASAPTAYAGTTPCSSGDFIASLNASGVATCATPAGGGNVTAAGTLTADRLVLGAGPTAVAVLGSLGTTSTVLQGNAGGAPVFATVTAVLDAALGSTQGDLLYRNATVWTVLAPGSAGQFLQTAGAAANPLWATPAGSGTVVTTGSPANGNLTMFSGPTSITNGNLSGDVTTTNTLVTALSVTGVGAGTYGQVTVDTKGRVTTGTIIADVTHGGTGGNVLTASGVLLGNGTSPVTTVAPGGANTVLHGSTPPTYSAVNLASQITGLLPLANICGAGVGAGPTTFLRGDCVWAVPAGGGTVTGSGAVGQETYWSASSVVAGTPSALNVRGWGTTAAAFNSAIQALPLTGGTILVPGGIYTLGGATIVVDRPVTIRGEGRGGTILSSTANPAFDVTEPGTGGKSVGRVSFEDFTLTLGGGTTGIRVNVSSQIADSLFRGLAISGGAKAIDIQNRAVKNNIVSNYLAGSGDVLTLTNAANQDAGDNYVIGNDIEGQSSGSVGIVQISAGLRMTGNKIYAVNTGMHIRGGEQIITGNTIIATGVATGGVALDFVSTNSLEGGRDFTIVGNYLNGAQSATGSIGIRMRAAGGGSWASGTISGNSFRLVDMSLDLDGDISWLTITGNAGQGWGGIKVNNGTNNLSASGNQFSQFGSPTIYVVTGSGTIKIESNETQALGDFPAAADGSAMYCYNCRGSQDGGYATGACVTGGTGATAKRQAGTWQC